MRWEIGIMLVGVLWMSGPVSAETPEEKGLAVAIEDDKLDNGFVGGQTRIFAKKPTHEKGSVRFLRRATGVLPRMGERQ